MVKFAKYLSICVILASSRFIGASKIPPTEDCDYEKEAGGDYFASGSAHSSQFLMPDGSVLTNSKGSSVSSDGIQRTFHELKKEANKFVSKSSDGLTIPSGALIPEIPEGHFSSFYKKDGAFSGGEQSSFSSSQSGSSGSSQYFDQQHFSQLPTDSKITTFKKQEVKKVVTKSTSGSSPNSQVTGEFDEEQNQGANSHANVNAFIYKPTGTAVQNGYSSNHHQESGSYQASSSNVNPAPGTAHQTFVYPAPLELYERENNHGSEGIRVTKVNNPSTYTGKTIIYSPVPSSDASSSVSKVESYSQQQHDANADIPSYLITKPNTFSVNLVEIDKLHNFPGIIPSALPSQTESHYDRQSYSGHTEQKETKQYAVPLVPVVPKVPNHINDNEEAESLGPEPLDSSGKKPVIVSSEKVVAVPSTDGRHTTFKVKFQAPAETVGSSQTYRKETHSHLSKSFSTEGGADSVVPSESQVYKNEGAAHLSQTGEHFEQNSQKTGDVVQIPVLVHGVPQKSGDAVQIPILVHGVPQNTGFYSSKSGSSSSQSFSSGSQFGESSGGSQNLKYTGAANFDAANLFGNSDKFSIPVQTFVSPAQTSKSSSSSSYHYFSSNGQAGEQLVPNSNIFANSDGSSFHQGHGVLLQNLGKSNVGSDTEFIQSSFGTPQKKTYGFSTAYSSHSSNVNGKVTENREAAVAVNDNGKIDSYHVKS